MNNLTRNGIAKDLAKSPYIFTEKIGNQRLDLYFSSRLHVQNFSQKRDENYNMIYNHIYKRFKYQTECRLLSELNLYQKIERRGFYVKIDKEVYTCPGDIILSGERKTRKN